MSARAQAVYELTAEDKSKRAFDSIKRNIGDVGGAFNRLAGLVAGVAGAAGLGAMVKNSLDTADAAGKLARQLGLTTQSYTALTYAAELGGVSNEQFAAGMRQISSNAFDAARGSREATAKFDALGLSVTDATGTLKSGDKLLYEIAERFKGMADGAAKTALAQDLMGRSGAAMIPVLNGGADGLRSASEEAARFGQVLTDETALGAALVNDNLTRMKKADTGMANQITQGMLPTLANLSQILVGTAGNTSAMDSAARAASAGLKILASGGVIVQSVFKTVGDALGAVAAALAAVAEGELSRAWEIVKLGVTDAADTGQAAADRLAQVWDDAAGRALIAAQVQADAGEKAFQPLIELPEKAAKATRKVTDEVTKQLGALQQQVATLGLSKSEMEMYKLQSQGASEAQLGLARSLLATVDAFDQQQAMADEAGRIYADTREPLELLNVQYARLNELLDAGKLDWDTYSRAVFAAQDAFDAASGAAAEAGDVIDHRFSGMFDGMTDAISDFVRTGKLDFKSLADSIIADLIRMQAQALITDVLKPLLANLLPSLLPSAHGNIFNNAPGLSAYSGSVVDRPTVFPFATGVGLMGEAGPEAILPLQRLPGGDLGVKAEGGGAKVVVNVVNQSGARATTRERTEGGTRIVDVLIEQVESRIAGNLSRGAGPVAGALAGTYGLNRVAGAY